jgi:hypothetical protein
VHILTKILVVLVALLVVALVPLAAVSSTNQLAFKQKAADAESALKTETASTQAAKDAYNASIVALQGRNASLEKQLATSNAQTDAERQARSDFERQVEGLRIQVAESQGQISKLAVNASAQTELLKEYSSIIETARSQYLSAEKQRVELQDALARAQVQLESETAAKSLLQEQLQKLTEDKERVSADLSKYRAVHGNIVGQTGAPSAGAIDPGLPVPADRSLSATVISVTREPNSTLAEINVGSRDGVKEGWILTLADGSNFVGNLRIIEVDMNRSVGVVELEDVATRGKVMAGQRAIARKGE